MTTTQIFSVGFEELNTLSQEPPPDKGGGKKKKAKKPKKKVAKPK